MQICIKKSSKLFGATALVLINLIQVTVPAFALEYQSTSDIGFTFESAISMRVSGDLEINDLALGDYADSNVITLDLATNILEGYSLIATVGNSSSSATNTTDLTNLTNWGSTMNSLSVSDQLANMGVADVSENGKWGYSYSTDGDTWSNYSGLPLYSSGSGAVLVDTTTPLDNRTISFKIGAKASIKQNAGTYTNVINFAMVAPGAIPPAEQSPTVTPSEPSGSGSGDSTLYMQTATMANCGSTMVDIRDNQQYTTASIADLCWMTKNLNLGSALGAMVLTNTNTNISDSTYTLPKSSTAGFSSNTAQNLYKSGSTTCTKSKPCYTYYTYVTATAGTNPSSGAATADICPKGWRLPTVHEYSELESAIDVNNTTSYDFSKQPFYGVYSGDYSNSAYSNGGSYGDYWTADVINSTKANFIELDKPNGGMGYGNSPKKFGHAIRCVMK